MKKPGDAHDVFDARIEAAIAATDDGSGRSVQYECTTAAVVSPIHRAVENQGYRIVVDGTTEYFAKALCDDQADFFDFSMTADICSQVSTLGVTPALRFSHVESGVMVFDHLPADWAWGKVDHLAHRDVLENVIALKKKIHASSPFIRSLSVFDRIRDYWEKIQHSGAVVPDDVHGIVTKTATIEKAIHAGGIDSVPCHADGVASNLMIGPGHTVQLVDFDVSGNSDPHYDIATVMLEGFQSKSDQLTVIELYAGTLDERIYSRCCLYAIADDLMWALWGFLCFKTSHRTEVEFTKYAEWRLLRCRMNLNNPCFDTWLQRT